MGTAEEPFSNQIKLYLLHVLNTTGIQPYREMLTYKPLTLFLKLHCWLRKYLLN
jgi:hypothetical protein